MCGDIDISGYVFTQEEWLDLDDDLRTELLDTTLTMAETSGLARASAAEA